MESGTKPKTKTEVDEKLRAEMRKRISYLNLGAVFE